MRERRPVCHVHDTPMRPVDFRGEWFYCEQCERVPRETMRERIQPQKRVEVYR